ncbi:MAG: DnaJ domain-containing protein [Phycisphaerales bacterium]|nr:DnaJ domain-containing protein [Phycisphaerales bacterium]
MALERDPYDVLGVSRTASDEEIRQAYRALARTHHPDVSTEPDADKKFAEVQEAYELLSDAEKRAAFDRFGKAGPSGFPGGGAPGGGWGGQQVDPSQFSDLFEQMFSGDGGFAGGPRSASRPGPRHGTDVSKNLTVTFQTASLGGTEHLELENGDRVDLKIPAGVEDGAKLRLRGKGGPGVAGGSPGDVIVTISVGGHPYFTRQGLDLMVDIPITIAEAALGTSVRVKLLKGSVDVRIPPGSSSGTRLRVRDQGIETPDGKRGNLIASVEVVAPKNLSDAERITLESLGRDLPDPREGHPGVESVAEQPEA